jgi:large subunit ribosomal protein L13
LLRGKNKTIFTPHVDCGDYVIVINADKVVLTGNKERAKIYTRYTGYVGNQVVTTPAKLRRKHPEQILEHAILGMVPHTRQGRAQAVRLKVYAGAEHPHAAQTPEAVTIA